MNHIKTIVWLSDSTWSRYKIKMQRALKVSLQRADIFHRMQVDIFPAIYLSNSNFYYVSWANITKIFQTRLFGILNIFAKYCNQAVFNTSPWRKNWTQAYIIYLESPFCEKCRRLILLNVERVNRQTTDLQILWLFIKTKTILKIEQEKKDILFFN